MLNPVKYKVQINDTFTNIKEIVDLKTWTDIVTNLKDQDIEINDYPAAFPCLVVFLGTKINNKIFGLANQTHGFVKEQTICIFFYDYKKE